METKESRIAAALEKVKGVKSYSFIEKKLKSGMYKDKKTRRRNYAYLERNKARITHKLEKGKSHQIIADRAKLEKLVTLLSIMDSELDDKSSTGKSSPAALHKAFIEQIKSNPVDVYVSIGERFAKKGLGTEMPEFAPIVHFMKLNLHKPEINAACETNPLLKNMRNQADLALWHVSINLSWYPYYATLKAIFQGLQFLDNYLRYTQPSLNKLVPYYHEFRYLMYFDWLIERAPSVLLIPCMEALGETPLILTRSAPIFLIGVNFTLEHVDEYTQTPAEFFIHDVNHARRQYENSLALHKKYYKKMKIIDYYRMQHEFITKKIRPLIMLKDSTLAESGLLEHTSTEYVNGIKGVIKNILFEVLHEEADAAIPEAICEKIVKPSGDPSPFQFVVTDPETGAKDMKRVIVPGGSILGFVRYKLRYGFFDAAGSLKEYICPKKFRTSEHIAKGAEIILKFLKCEKVPDYATILAITNDNEGLNPPAHPNHLSEQFNAKTFTGIRPPSMPTYMFEEMYKFGVPWTGIEKEEKAVENYSASKLFVGEDLMAGRIEAE